MSLFDYERFRLLIQIKIFLFYVLRFFLILFQLTSRMINNNKLPYTDGRFRTYQRFFLLQNFKKITEKKLRKNFWLIFLGKGIKAFIQISIYSFKT